MAKKDNSMDVYIIGKGSKSVAIMATDNGADVPLNPSDSTFYSLSNNWDNTPKQYNLPSRSEQLKILLEEFNIDENDARISDRKVENFGDLYANEFIEYLEWELVKEFDKENCENTDWYKCKSTIKRAEVNEKNTAKIQNAFDSIELSKPYIVAICDSKSSPVSFNSLIGSDRDPKESEQQNLLQGAEHIVIRTSLSELDIQYSREDSMGEHNSKDNRFIAGQDEDSIGKYIMNNEDLAKKTIALVTIDSLRDHALNIRKGLSWDQMFTETLKELERIESIDKLKCLVVVFHHEGCLVRFSKDKRCVLFCSPTKLESAFEAELKNTPHSSMTLLQAVIVQGLEQLKKSNCGLDSKRGQELFCKYIHAGLEMRIYLLKKGYILEEKIGRLEMPAKRLSKFLYELTGSQKDKKDKDKDKEDDKFVKFDFAYELLSRGFSFFDHYINELNILDVCKQYVKTGKIHDPKLPKIDESQLEIPHYQKGKLVTYDRKEIEQFNNLDNLIRSYVASDITTPLSICVFGHPGSGKSFSVKQIAESYDEIEHASLEFNLSQMQSYDELRDAFHRVANVGLGGKIPLVFFDEFDSVYQDGSEFGWLKFFLAPIQDGVYEENNFRFVIGKSIFVFAGGICKDHKDFQEKISLASVSKGNDFISRIRGYVDIKTINPSTKDPLLPVFKRAQLLRSMIIRKCQIKDDDPIEIDDRVLNAFLKTPEFIHDARSMEAIINTSSIAKGCKITASCIENNCIDLHVSEHFQSYLRKTPVIFYK